MTNSEATLVSTTQQARWCEARALFVPVHQMQQLLREYKAEVHTLTIELSYDDLRLERAEAALVAQARELFCGYQGLVEVRGYSDGTAYWDCPRCGDHNEESAR